MQTCQRCKESKDPEAFGKGQRWCRTCYKAYHQANKIKAKARNRARYQAHKEEHLAVAKRWREAHPGKMQEYWRAWHLKHPGAATRFVNNARRKRPEHYRAYGRAYQKKNLDMFIAKHAARRARKLGAMTPLTTGEWAEIKATFNHHCAYCFQPFVRLHQEHLQPLSRWGPHAAANIVPVCRSCNSRKGPKTLVEFALATLR